MSRAKRDAKMRTELSRTGRRVPMDARRPL
jgi:hypothetical protein